LIEGTGRPLEVVIGEASLSDGPAEVSDNEDAGAPDNLEIADTSDVGNVPEAEESASQPQVFEAVEHVVPDTEEQLIDFDDDEEEMNLDEQPASTDLYPEPPTDDDLELPPPPPQPEQDVDDQ